MLLMPQSVFAAVGYDAASSAGGTGVALLQWDHTVTGSDTLLVCGGHANYFNGATTVDTFTYNAANLTLVATEPNAGEAAHEAIMYRRIAPTTGTNQVSVTWSQNSNVGLGCMSFTGADQITPLGADNADNDLDGTLSASITVPASGMGVSVAASNEGGVSCPDLTSGDTERFEVCSGTFESHGLGSTTASTGVLAMTWTLNANYSQMVAAPINPAAATSSARRVIVVE